MNKKFALKMSILISIMIVLFVLSLVIGAKEIKFKDLFALFQNTELTKEMLILKEIRIPRVIGALFIGGALGLSGTIMQGLTKNPLADPGLLGTTAGANLFLVVAMGLFRKMGYFNMMLFCFAGAALGTLLVFGLNNFNKKGSNLKLILAGSAVSSLFYGLSEAIGVSLGISKEVSMWTSGGLIGTSYDGLRVLISMIILGFIIGIFFSKELTILSLNDEVAIGLGQKTFKVKIFLFFALIILCGSSVALVGNMAFIGLIIPHLGRKLVGQDYKYLVPISFVLGALLLIISDTLARVISAPYETPLIAVISLISMPFFIVLIKKGGKLKI